MLSKLIIAVCAWLSLSSLAGGEVYKWVDEHGKKHYGDRPPAQASASKVAVPKSMPASSPAVSSEPAVTQQAPELPRIHRPVIEPPKHSGIPTQ
jgi:hypothetical protein